MKNERMKKRKRKIMNNEKLRNFGFTRKILNDFHCLPWLLVSLFSTKILYDFHFFRNVSFSEWKSSRRCTSSFVPCPRFCVVLASKHQPRMTRWRGRHWVRLFCVWPCRVGAFNGANSWMSREHTLIARCSETTCGLGPSQCLLLLVVGHVTQDEPSSSLCETSSK